MQSTENSLLFADLSEAAQESINGGISVSASVVGNGSASASAYAINGKQVTKEEFDAAFGNISLPKFESKFFSSSRFSISSSRSF